MGCRLVGKSRVKEAGERERERAKEAGERERERERESLGGRGRGTEREDNHVISCDPSPHKSVDFTSTELIFSILLPSPLAFANDLPCTGTACPLLLRPPGLPTRLEDDRGGPLRLPRVGRCRGAVNYDGALAFAWVLPPPAFLRVIVLSQGPKTSSCAAMHSHQEQRSIWKSKLEDGGTGGSVDLWSLRVAEAAIAPGVHGANASTYGSTKAARDRIRIAILDVRFVVINTRDMR